MKLSTLSLIAFCLCPPPLAIGQTSSAPTRSHVERFSTPSERAERSEADSTKKLAVNPNDAEALNSRSLARMRLGRYKEALEDLQRAVSLSSGNAGYQANLGYALWKIGRFSEAIEAERAAIKLEEKNFTAHYQLGRFLLRTGDPRLLAEAATHLRRAVEIDPRQYDVRLELIAVYRQLGDTAQALAQYELLQDARPSDPRVIHIHALLAADRGDINTAINGFRDALRGDQSLYGAWQDLGLAYMKLNHWSEAVETFGELVRLQAYSVEAAYFHALSLFNAGRVSQAEAETRRALRLDAGVAPAHTLLGIILASRRANNEASEALAQAAALDPKSFDAHFYLGRVQYALKDYSAAAKSLGTAVNLGPRHSQARFFLGTALESAGETDSALAQYQELVKIDQQSAMGLIGSGALLVKQGKTSEAIDMLRQATALDRKSFEAHWALGRALALAERYSEAVEALKTSVLLAPDRPDAHYQLGLALRRLGRNEEAAREFVLVDQINTEFRTRSANN
jgi:tetratricopeptide (TPR) repeat protein